jgi:hypothetical protein
MEELSQLPEDLKLCLNVMRVHVVLSGAEDLGFISR